MGWLHAYVENPDGSRGRTICKDGDDPLRDDAPKKQIEREIEKFEDWSKPANQPGGGL